MSATVWQSGRIPGRREYGGVLIVSATLNGTWAVELLADTGAAYTFLNRDTLRALEVDLSRPAGSYSVAIADPRGPVRVPVYKIDSLRVGPFEVQEFDVGMMELPSYLRINGILGVSFLEGYRSTFDFRNQVVILRR